MAEVSTIEGLDQLTPEITMGDLLQVFPGARRALFANYHIGGCSSCGFDMGETLAAVCARNEDLPVAEVIGTLRASAEHDAALQVAPLELNARLEAGEEIALLDIRSPEEHEAVAIPGSTLFTQELMQEIMGNWPKDAAFVLYDHLGERVLDAVAFFTGHGFPHAKALRGGIDQWSQDVDPDLPRYTFE